MGCDESTPSTPKNEPVIAEKIFMEMKLQHLITPNMNFENPLEKDIFMAINVLRGEPAIYVQVINDVQQQFPIYSNKKYTDRLIKMLDMNEKMPEIIFDVAATEAAKNNNRLQCSPGVVKAPFGGNIAALNRLIGI